jgi:hypothetical protein
MPTRCLCSLSKVTGSPPSPGSVTRASSRTSGCRARCGTRYEFLSARASALREKRRSTTPAGRSSAGPARPAARPTRPLSIGRTLPSPLLFARQSRSSLSPTSRNIRSTTAPRPTEISAMASTSPVNPPTRAAQIEPATTSAAADPNARTRGRGATVPRYRFDWPRSRSQSPGTRVPLRARRTRRQYGRLEAEQY